MNSRLALAALLAIFVAAPTQADDGNDPNHPILKDVLRIQKEVERLRGLKFQAPVKAGVWKPDRLKTMLLKDFDKEAPAEKVADEGKVLKLFGLLPQGFDYRKEMISFLTNQIGGFYRPDKKLLYLVDRSGQPAMGGPQAQKMNDQMVMAHELHHALQDQNFALDRWFELLGEHNDRVQGYKGLVEGEAQLVGMTYLMQSMGRRGQPDMKNMNRMNKMMMKMTPQGRKLAKIPSFLIDNMMFPYTEGAEFVQALYRKKGWAGISQAFLNPPASTEQVLHLEKYLNRDEPQEIRLPKGLKGVLGEKTRELTANTLGEYSTMILLRGLGIPERTAKKAAAGWDGDRYIGFETAKKEVVLLWLTTWDNVAEATEFEETYKRALAAKHPGAVVIRRGTEVMMVEGAPAAVREKLINKAFKSVKVEERWTPTPDLTKKPPLSDFVKGKAGVAATPKPVTPTHPRTPAKASVGRLTRLDDIGVAFVAPKGFILGNEPITELQGQFKSAYFAGPNKQHLRVIQLPFPYDAASKQLEGLIQQGMQTVTVEEKTEVMIHGRKATRVVFSAILPGDSKVSRNVTLVVGMGPGSVVLGLSQPKTAKAASAHRVLQAVTDTLWLDRAGNTAKSKGFGSAKATVGKYRFKIPSVLASVQSQSSGPIVHAQKDAQGAKVQVVVQRATGSIEDYGTALEAQLPHLPGSPHLHAAGVVVRSGRQVHEIEFQRGDRRYRQLTVVRGGKRWTVSVSAPTASFDSYRNAFGQVLSGFQLEKAVKKREVF